MHIARELRRLNRFSFLARNQNFTNGELFEKMEHVTKLKRDSALKNLYQKTQASLLRIFYFGLQCIFCLLENRYNFEFKATFHLKNPD